MNHERWIAEAMRLADEYAMKMVGISMGEAPEKAKNGREALRAHFATVPSVPDGWVMVPVEPTREMVKAGASCSSANMVWRYMIAAAPKQEKP